LKKTFFFEISYSDFKIILYVREKYNDSLVFSSLFVLVMFKENLFQCIILFACGFVVSRLSL